MKVFFATRVRGFFRHLFSCRDLKVDFQHREASTYEVNSRLHAIAARCVRSRIGNWLGLVQAIPCKNTGCDVHGSYNRFLDSDRPYFIYVENPTALYHYALGRNRSWLGRRVIGKQLSSQNLKALIFMSQACATTFQEVCGPIPAHCLQAQIYPLIPENRHVSEAQIKWKQQRASVKLLYIAQGVRFLSKGALEILAAYRQLRNEGVPCSLTMLTNIAQIDASLRAQIENTADISLLDFKFSYGEMEQLYADHDVLLQPTSDDSSPLTVLEAMHAGLAIVASRLYAIPEMVEDGVNGYLIDPAYWFFDRNNRPNPTVWNHRKKTIYAGKCVESVAANLYDRLNVLLGDRELLTRMGLNSYRRSQNQPFSRQYIIQQWNNLLESLNN